MALNYIWLGFFLIAFVVALVRLLGYYYRENIAEITGIIFDKADEQVFTAIVESTFKMAETGVTISIFLIGVMTLWLGIMRIGEAGGAIHILSRFISPFFRKLFPELPENHPAGGSMLMNFSANMLGLDNAATPLGLKAMNELQEINPQKDTASNAQIMFLVLNTSGLTVIPVSVMALRAAGGAANPSDVFLPILLATYFSTLAGLIAVAIYQKINLFNAVVISYIGSITVVIGIIIWYFSTLPAEDVGRASGIVGNLLLFLIITGFLTMAARKKINVFETFIDGAKDGFNIAVKIIPYLVGMLVAIGVFRASGALDFLVDSIAALVSLTGLDTRFVDALPTAFMKPLSGSGARGMMVETMATHGADSFAGKLASVFQGSTETTFYTLAVYFGSVGIRKSRYAVTCGLIADFAGITAAIFIAYMFFG
ncbi:MAG: spore maturation protein [Bacteroidetes bacterium]|nr:spore maturation protein [Bacteroidota bacterium]HET6245608.1 nucleoside recognition domain-containing protein [Bacteroidia bacterium]